MKSESSIGRKSALLLLLLYLLLVPLSYKIAKTVAFKNTHTRSTRKMRHHTHTHTRSPMHVHIILTIAIWHRIIWIIAGLCHMHVYAIKTLYEQMNSRT